MPELPEVETVARQLAPQISGRKVRSLRILDPLLGPIPAGRVRASRVEKVFRLGKQVVLALERPVRTNPRVWLSVHLRMTGRLIWRPGVAGTGGEERHRRAVLVLEGGLVDFVDPRRFGVIRLTDDLGDFQPPGVDPTGGDFTPARLRQLLTGSGQEIKPWLLRQDRITGLAAGYRPLWHHLFRLSGCPWRDGRFSAVSGRLWPRGRTLPALPQPGQSSGAAGTQHLFLPRLPAGRE